MNKIKRHVKRNSVRFGLIELKRYDRLKIAFGYVSAGAMYNKYERNVLVITYVLKHGGMLLLE